MDCLIKYIGIWTILYDNMVFKYFFEQKYNIYDSFLDANEI